MNFYDVLGVARDADRSAVRRAYRGKAGRVHPDVNEHPEAREQFRVLTTARDVLTDPDERTEYERLGHTDYVRRRLEGNLSVQMMDPRPPDGDDATTERSGGGSVKPEERSGGGGSVKEWLGEDGSVKERPGDGGSAKSGEVGPVDRGAAATSSDDDPTSREGARTTSSGPPTPGAGRTTSESRAMGPWRLIRDERRRVGRERRGVLGSATVHFTASHRWLVVAAASVVYFAGIAEYLQANRSGVDTLLAELIALDPVILARALAGDRYGVPDVPTFVGTVGLHTGPVPTDAALLLSGVAVLPVAVAFAVVGLTRETTWRPAWIHVGGVLGPATAVVLPVVVSTYPERSPFTTVPLLVDLLLLVVAPAVVVTSFLVCRLLVVMPLRRRRDLREQ